MHDQLNSREDIAQWFAIPAYGRLRDATNLYVERWHMCMQSNVQSQKICLIDDDFITNVIKRLLLFGTSMEGCMLTLGGITNAKIISNYLNISGYKKDYRNPHGNYYGRDIIRYYHPLFNSMFYKQYKMVSFISAFNHIYVSAFDFCKMFSMFDKTNIPETKQFFQYVNFLQMDILEWYSMLLRWNKSEYVPILFYIASLCGLSDKNIFRNCVEDFCTVMLQPLWERGLRISVDDSCTTIKKILEDKYTHTEEVRYNFVCKFIQAGFIDAVDAILNLL
jgi:hypothetical protein